jgi:hypothetical protein
MANKALKMQDLPQLMTLLAEADHVDVKVVTGDVSLPEFVAGMFSYYPGWIKNLYQIRWGFVRLLGMKQAGIPAAAKMRPEDVPMIPGEKAAFFTVTLAEEGRCWVAEAAESHLTAYLGVVMEPLSTRVPSTENRFHVLTIVHYHKWTGPVYFNVIRPFHHLVVRNMAKAGVCSWA